MTERAQGQPGADRAVGRPGPAARMTPNGEPAKGSPAAKARLGRERPAELHRPQFHGPGLHRPERSARLHRPLQPSAAAEAPTRSRPSVLIAPVPSPASTRSGSRGAPGAPTSRNGKTAASSGAGRGSESAATGSAAKASAAAGTGKAAAPAGAAVAAGATSPDGPPTHPAGAEEAILGKRSILDDRRSGPAHRAVAGPDHRIAPASPDGSAPVGGGPGGLPHGVGAARGAAAGAAAASRRRPTSSAGKLARTAVQGRPGPRSARLYVTHIDPWSVMKQAFLLALALAVLTLAAFATLWFALESAGVLDAVTRTATDVGGESGANVSAFLSFSKVMGAALIVAGIETVLVTALATLFAFLYNLAVAIGGGVEVTLSEDA